MNSSIADKSCYDGYDETRACCHDVRTWCYSNKTDNRTYRRAHTRRLMPTETVNKYPRHHSCGTSGISVEKRLDSYTVSSKTRTAVKAEPSKPQQCCSEDDKRYVGRYMMRRLSILPASQEQGTGKCRYTA